MLYGTIIAGDPGPVPNNGLSVNCRMISNINNVSIFTDTGDTFSAITVAVVDVTAQYAYLRWSVNSNGNSDPQDGEFMVCQIPSDLDVLVQ